MSRIKAFGFSKIVSNLFFCYFMLQFNFWHSIQVLTSHLHETQLFCKVQKVFFNNFEFFLNVHESVVFRELTKPNFKITSTNYRLNYICIWSNFQEIFHNLTNNNNNNSTFHHPGQNGKSHKILWYLRIN